MTEEKKTEVTSSKVDVTALAKEYIEWEPHSAFKNEVKDALSKNDTQLLQKMFGKRISFGTAGLRSYMGGGYSRMNDLIIIQTTQGLVKYLENTIKDCKNKGVIIGYDARYNSKRFAHLSATIFKDSGFKIYLFNRYAATPLIPFGVLLLKCCLGIVVTASHNPKEDNGFKVYLDNGSQIIPPHDKNISNCINNNLKPWNINNLNKYKLNNLVECNKDNDITDKVGNEYFRLASEKYCYFKDTNKNTKLKVVFTPVHGIGGYWMDKAFKSFNLHDFIPVKEQIEPDPLFSTVTFPNPEEKSALKLAMETGDNNNIRLILANDPDSDRLAIAEKDINTNKWYIFNGNEIAALLSDWAYKNYIKLNPKCDKKKLLFLNSTVSSKYLESYCNKNGTTFIDTLTGFKWMGNKAVEMIKKGYTFIFAYEVEIGFLIGDLSFDKDGLRCATAFNEMAIQLYNNNLTCMDKLNELRKKYGYYEMINLYKFMTDEKLENIFNKLRNWNNIKNNYPKTLGDIYQIERVRDVTLGYDSGEIDNKCKMPLTPNNHMITFWFENGSTITMRNSGTEPKLKYYVESRDDKNPKNAKTIVSHMAKTLLKEFMGYDE